MKARASRRKISLTSFAHSSPPKDTAPDWDCRSPDALWKRTAGKSKLAARWAKARDSRSGCPSYGKRQSRLRKHVLNGAGDGYRVSAVSPLRTTLCAAAHIQPASKQVT